MTIPSPDRLPEPPADLLAALEAARRPLLLTHVHPDGDGIGSQLGLARALRSRGARPRILNSHGASEKFDFLDPDREVQVSRLQEPLDDLAQQVAEADLLVILDTSDSDRLGHLAEAVWQAPAPRVCIDHHLCEAPERFDRIWSVPTSPSTGNLVLEVITGLGIELTAEMATPLFVAVATDTGWFRFGNARPSAYEAAARLAAAGADPELIYREVFESSSLTRMQLLGEVLADCRSVAGGRVVYAVLRREALERSGVPYEEIDGFIDFLKGVREGQIAFLVVELSPGRYKVSLRSRAPVSVHAVASLFGGGGHAQASGCRLAGTEEEVLARVLEAATQQLSA